MNCQIDVSNVEYEIDSDEENEVNNYAKQSKKLIRT